MMGLTGCGIKTVARVFFYAPLILLGGAAYLAPLQPAQLETLSLVLYKLNNQTAGIACIFFGVELVFEGWLLFQSGFLPRFLGVVTIISGFGWFTYIWPPFISTMFLPVALFTIAGAFVKIGWLFIRGIDDAKWRERAAQ